jgi:hypothetical protein
VTQRRRRTLALLATAGLAIGLVSATAGGAEAKPETTDQNWRSLLPAYTPTNVHAVDATSSSVTVGWDGPAGATRYRVVWADNPDMTDRHRRWTGNEQTTIDGLAADSSTWVKVRVVELYGMRWVGPASSPLEVRTEPADGGQPAPAPSPSPSPTGSTLFGANYTTLSLVDERIYDGRAQVARIFFQQLDGTQFSRNGAVQEALGDGVKTFVISWKETDLSAIRTFLAGIPDGLTVYTTFNHEPEDDHGRPGSATYKAWSAEYKRQWALQSPVMRAQGTIPTNILMAWTLSPKSGRDVADWTPPRGTVDVFAFDAYYGKGKDPSALVDRIVTATRAAGLSRTGLGETGAPASDPSRVLNTREMHAAVKSAGIFDFACYWNSAEGTGYDSRMDAATVDAWFG